MACVAAKVSIVVPCYNQARVVPMTLDHVFQQEWPNLEVIVVDGGSSDGSVEVIRDYLDRLEDETVSEVARYDGEKVLRRERPRFPEGRKVKAKFVREDIGATQTYNEGFKLATGEYCTYVVGDDLPHPTMVPRLVEALEREKVDFVYADMMVVDDEGRILRVIRKPDYSFEACFAEWFHLGVARLYRRAWHEKVGLFDVAYRTANDYDMYLRMAMAGCTFHHVPEVLYSVRWHGERRRTGQHTETADRRLIGESIRCAERARAWWRKKETGGA